MISSLKLAELCGVSHGTVDRAIHGRPGVSEKTRQRILQAARKYGYRPNPAARELLGRTGRTVGAIVPTLNSIFFMDLMNACKEKLAAAGFRLMLTPVSHREDFLETLEDFAARKMRAALVVPPEDMIPIPQTVTAEMPVVSLLSPCEGKNVIFIAPNEVHTGRDAVDYLSRRGHERILHVTYPRRFQSVLKRAEGYRQRMIELGRNPVVRIYQGGDCLHQPLLRNRPTAIFCHNDWLALCVIRILRDLYNKNVPSDISVLGVDNSPTFNSLFPDLTTLEYPVAGLTRYILEFLTRETTDFTFPPMKVIERRTVTSHFPSKSL
jgi:LacI family transcriptional regulator